MELIFGTFALQLGTFIILYFLLKKYAFGPLLGVMNKRADYIQSQLADAEKSREEAERLAQEHRTAIQNAKQEAHDMMENARRTGEKQAADLIAAAEAEAKRIKDEAIADIGREKERAVAELRDQVGALSVMLAGKILNKELDASKHQALFDEAVKEMGERVC